MPPLSFSSLMRVPSAYLPLVLSSLAFALIAGVLLTVGVTPQPDEGTPAHLFQLLMVLQLPVVAWFAIRWLPRGAMAAVAVLCLQVAAAVAAIGLVAWLERGVR